MDCRLLMSEQSFTPSPGQHSRKPRVLVVEDDFGNASVLREVLEFLGHAVSVANDAPEAIRLTECEAFDLVVSDIGLPGMSGLDLMEELRRRSAVPGIALTGFGGNEEAELCRRAGFSEHIIKPVEIAELEAAIRRVLGTQLDAHAQ